MHGISEVTFRNHEGSEQLPYLIHKINPAQPYIKTIISEGSGKGFDLLNIQYFHVVFTVPAELDPLFLSNQEKLYRLLFSCAAETLMQLAWDKKYLGAQIGCIEVLHTWGQNLHFHPHIHCIVPGGGLNKIGQWVPSLLLAAFVLISGYCDFYFSHC